MEIFFVISLVLVVAFFLRTRSASDDTARRPDIHRPVPTPAAVPGPARDARRPVVPVARPAPQPPLPQIDRTPFEGAAWVIDGDTIAVAGKRIRLAGIDAPELDQPYGKKAKWAMVALTKGRKVRVVPTGEISHDRLVARCYVEEDTDIGAEMVRTGFALDWTAISGGEYRALEQAGARRRLYGRHHGGVRYRQNSRPE